MSAATQLDREIVAKLHRLRFEGSGNAVMGRCTGCDTVHLQGLGSGTPRQQIKAKHEKHLDNMARCYALDKL